ncbi:N-6 DNA methylase [Nannocystis pusilla]|uniref:site-specific DNA-methyltransferase (adenine-specific) n=1 Tax=Nannocystis pusilla TaxID=889268 RepID=A0ABS7TKH0_9BACT|nr:N-6 DNA methylase [Nannocystis pusilla]MBZ5708735.1 N-6 DNA methylase [Nannocystis pusilla]
MPRPARDRRARAPRSAAGDLPDADDSHRHAFAVATELKRRVRQSIEQLADEVVHHQAPFAADDTFADRLARECVVYLHRLLCLFHVEARGVDVGITALAGALAAPAGHDLDLALRDLFRRVESGRFPGLRSDLFAAARTPLLTAAPLRNDVLQAVVRRLGECFTGAGVGIHQLGAVHEGLLGYTGFFAREDVYEVRAAADVKDDDARTTFVPRAQIDAYPAAQRVREASGRPVVHPRGKFLYRLAGREREKSGSYYTPELLTRCLTRYTLAERLGEANAASADDLLQLTICEPAMGSGAFLVEALDQLADAYLARKQTELGRKIAADELARERQRVKFHLAVHNCYGVDLDPLAAELGKIALALHVLHPGAPAPRLDLRIAAGNSLLGARKAVFTAADLARKGWSALEPTPVPIAAEPPGSGIYHFLVADAGMLGFDDDASLRSLEPAAAAKIRVWRREMAAPYDESHELPRLAAISRRIDALWREHLAEREAALLATRQPVPLWGQPTATIAVASPPAALDRPDAPGKRLAAIMDYWCALWFWPIGQVALLPSRDRWLADVEALLDAPDLAGATDDPAHPALAVARRTAGERRFFHWELAFPEVFARRGGMDIILGNPPWTKVVWEEAGVLAELQPRLAIDRASAPTARAARERALVDPTARSAYLRAFTGDVGTRNFLACRSLYALLGGTASNLYKAFLVRAWSLAGPRASVGLFHQTGIFDDPAGGPLRAELHHRLRFAARFQNKLNLFPAVLHTRPYAFTISGERRDSPDFLYAANLFHPRTIDESLVHDGRGETPGVKTEQGEWDLRGHRHRLVRVDVAALEVFRAVFDTPDTPLAEARLPIVHSVEVLSILRKIAGSPRRMLDLADAYTTTEHFHETNHQKDGTIVRETRRPADLAQWIVSGPHYYVATPFARDPNEGCRSHMDYTTVDLTTIAADWLPRTNYRPTCSPAEYEARTPRWRGAAITTRHRWIGRKMLAPTGERTLIAAVLPPGPAHIGASVSLACIDDATLMHFAGLSASLPYDFWLKITGKANLSNDVIKFLPLPPARRAQLVLRALLLNCLTAHYAGLWRSLFADEFRRDRFASADPRLPGFDCLQSRWTPDTPLRTPFARRHALVELDALAALALGLSLDELLSIYRLQFAVLQQNERGTWYDRRGKVVFSDNVLLSGLGLPRRRWQQIAGAGAGDRLPEWARDAQGVYVPPFDRCDREADLRRAYAWFAAQA